MPIYSSTATATATTATTTATTATSTVTASATPFANKKLVGYMTRLNQILVNLTKSSDKKITLDRISLLKAEVNTTLRRL